MANANSNSIAQKEMKGTLEALTAFSDCSKQQCKEYKRKEQEIAKKYIALRQKVDSKDFKKWQQELAKLTLQQDKELYDVYACIIAQCGKAINNVVVSKLNYNKATLTQLQRSLETSTSNDHKQMLKELIKSTKSEISTYNKLLAEMSKGNLDPSKFRKAVYT